MKSLLLLCFSTLLFSFSIDGFAQCEGDITLTSQAEIDAFLSNYGCSVIEGDLTVEESQAGNIVDLSNLESITQINGNLLIQKNDSLTSLNGLNNLLSVGGNLWIGSNYMNNLNGLNNLNSVGENFYLSDNQLSNINDLDQLNSIGGDLLISFCLGLDNLNGLSNLNSIGGDLTIGFNGLNNIAGLNNLNSIGGDLLITENYLLETCCSVINILDYVQGDLAIFNNTPTCNSLESIIASCNISQVQAQAFFDENENEVFDENEQMVQQSFNLEPSALFAFSDENGIAHLYLDNFGEYQLSLNNTNPLWTTNGPEIIQINYEDSTFIDTLHYFPMNPTVELINQNIDIASSITRCNQETNYWLTYSNKGTTINEGYVQLVADELTTFVSANPPVDSTAGDTLYWFYENLYPTHSNKIQLVYQMPSVDFIGEEITFEAQMQTTEGFGESKKIISSELICAYDPNDKLVTPEGVGAENYTLFGDTLEYTIRFQNTGNDTAFTVIIEDELSEYLDLNTFRPIASSHNVETQIDLNTNIATFTFNDIYLPDSFVNEPASHGFVKFQIQSNENLSAFTAIENTAEIFFDANPAIVTNTVLNTFTETIPAVFLGKIFLEGCYDGNGQMTTNLSEWLPLNQPFGNAPYNYQGNETINSVPSEMVDWVLVEARTGTPNLAGSPGTTVVETIAGILLNDGSIVNTDGTTGLRFLNLESGQEYYFAIRQRNHLDVLTATSVLANLNMAYDFTLSPEMAFGNQQQKLSNDGIPVLFAGDANGDGLILNTDFDQWFLNNAVLNTYSSTDWNLDGTIQTTDYDLWFLNKAKVGIVELQY